MAYKCRVCGSNDVDNQGDVCELCAIWQDPYAQVPQTPQNTYSNIPNSSQSNNSGNSYVPKKGNSRKVLLNGGAPLTNTDPYGNDMTVTTNAQNNVQVYAAGQAVTAIQNTPPVVQNQNAPTAGRNVPVTAGICKNILVDKQKRSVLFKWFRSLFTGTPFALDDDVTMFQVFPDYTGTALNSLGYACDQVIVHGRLNNGSISENNDVEVYGHRDSKNNVIATVIKNRASGTTITASRTIGHGVVLAISLFVFCVLAGLILTTGPIGILCAVLLFLCMTNLPRAWKIIGAILAGLLTFGKRIFRWFI